MEAKGRIKMLADEQVQRIMVNIYETPKSAQQLSEECGIPLATCHRKLKDMEKMGLIKFKDIDASRKGHLVKLYSCELENSKFVFENGRFKFQMQKKGDDEGNGKWIELISSSSG